MHDTWFKDWFNSPYYHRLYAHRDEKEAADFIDLLIQHLAPATGATMLDVACGKGRHSMQLAAAGFDVTGIDLSRESIADATQHAHEHLHFLEHDMRLPFWVNYFDVAFNFFTSFGYFNTQREHDNAIRTIATAVKYKGIFVMDYLNITFADTHEIIEATQQIESTTYHVTKWTDNTHFYKKIVVEDAALPQPIQYTEKVSKFSVHDFKQMFAKQGLTIKEVYGDYQFKAFDEATSPRLIMIAQKM
ncbi:class I SAM-dependent methyltransferase [Ferruginibacter yonginensis]|uniref:Class I SAM-dependent methyltransferase n=1 Tax=Ferruginibacter yonginensis TaxID=1310416 RepID=A0ABV8QSV7_9BACT